VDKIDRCVTEEGILGSMKQTLVDAKELMRTIQTLVEQNKGDFHQAVHDFKVTSSELRSLVEENLAAVDSTVEQFQASAERFDSVVVQLEDMSSTLKTISERIDRGDGTLGQLLNNRELYDDLQQTTKEINLLIEDIKKHPGKYFKISVFDF
jgi:phospholipid/cholesterol/gamma-HCH transport system substrate-binding protein